jgi:hypothetical protein
MKTIPFLLSITKRPVSGLAVLLRFSHPAAASNFCYQIQSRPFLFRQLSAFRSFGSHVFIIKAG